MARQAVPPELWRRFHSSEATVAALTTTFRCACNTGNSDLTKLRLSLPGLLELLRDTELLFLRTGAAPGFAVNEDTARAMAYAAMRNVPMRPGDSDRVQDVDALGTEDFYRFALLLVSQKLAVPGVTHTPALLNVANFCDAALASMRDLQGNHFDPFVDHRTVHEYHPRLFELRGVQRVFWVYSVPIEKVFQRYAVVFPDTPQPRKYWGPDQIQHWANAFGLCPRLLGPQEVEEVGRSVLEESRIRMVEQQQHLPFAVHQQGFNELLLRLAIRAYNDALVFPTVYLRLDALLLSWARPYGMEFGNRDITSDCDYATVGVPRFVSLLTDTGAFSGGYPIDLRAERLTTRLRHVHCEWTFLPPQPHLAIFTYPLEGTSVSQNPVPVTLTSVTHTTDRATFKAPPARHCTSFASVTLNNGSHIVTAKRTSTAELRISNDGREWSTTKHVFTYLSPTPQTIIDPAVATDLAALFGQYCRKFPVAGGAMIFPEWELFNLDFGVTFAIRERFDRSATGGEKGEQVLRFLGFFTAVVLAHLQTPTALQQALFEHYTSNLTALGKQSAAIAAGNTSGTEGHTSITEKKRQRSVHFDRNSMSSTLTLIGDDEPNLETEDSTDFLEDTSKSFSGSMLDAIPAAQMDLRDAYAQKRLQIFRENSSMRQRNLNQAAAHLARELTTEERLAVCEQLIARKHEEQDRMTKREAKHVGGLRNKISHLADELQERVDDMAKCLCIGEEYRTMFAHIVGELELLRKLSEGCQLAEIEYRVTAILDFCSTADVMRRTESAVNKEMEKLKAERDESSKAAQEAQQQLLAAQEYHKQQLRALDLEHYEERQLIQEQYEQELQMARATIENVSRQMSDMQREYSTGRKQDERLKRRSTLELTKLQRQHAEEVQRLRDSEARKTAEYEKRLSTLEWRSKIDIQEMKRQYEAQLQAASSSAPAENQRSSVVSRRSKSRALSTASPQTPSTPGTNLLATTPGSPGATLGTFLTGMTEVVDDDLHLLERQLRHIFEEGSLLPSSVRELLEKVVKQQKEHTETPGADPELLLRELTEAREQISAGLHRAVELDRALTDAQGTISDLRGKIAQLQDVMQERDTLNATIASQASQLEAQEAHSLQLLNKTRLLQRQLDTIQKSSQIDFPMHLIPLVRQASEAVHTLQSSVKGAREAAATAAGDLSDCFSTAQEALKVILRRTVEADEMEKRNAELVDELGAVRQTIADRQRDLLRFMAAQETAETANAADAKQQELFETALFGDFTDFIPTAPTNAERQKLLLHAQQIKELISKIGVVSGLADQERKNKEIAMRGQIAAFNFRRLALKLQLKTTRKTEKTSSTAVMLHMRLMRMERLRQAIFAERMENLQQLLSGQQAAEVLNEGQATEAKNEDADGTAVADDAVAAARDDPEGTEGVDALAEDDEEDVDAVAADYSLWDEYDIARVLPVIRRLRQQRAKGSSGNYKDVAVQAATRDGRVHATPQGPELNEVVRVEVQRKSQELEKEQVQLKAEIARLEEKTRNLEMESRRQQESISGDVMRVMSSISSLHTARDIIRKILDATTPSDAVEEKKDAKQQKGATKKEPKKEQPAAKVKQQPAAKEGRSDVNLLAEKLSTILDKVVDVFRSLRGSDIATVQYLAGLCEEFAVKGIELALQDGVQRFTVDYEEKKFVSEPNSVRVQHTLEVPPSPWLQGSKHTGFWNTGVSPPVSPGGKSDKEPENFVALPVPSNLEQPSLETQPEEKAAPVSPVAMAMGLLTTNHTTKSAPTKELMELSNKAPPTSMEPQAAVSLEKVEALLPSEQPQDLSISQMALSETVCIPQRQIFPELTHPRVSQVLLPSQDASVQTQAAATLRSTLQQTEIQDGLSPPKSSRATQTSISGEPMKQSVPSSSSGSTQTDVEQRSQESQTEHYSVDTVDIPAAVNCSPVPLAIGSGLSTASDVEPCLEPAIPLQGTSQPVATPDEKGLVILGGHPEKSSGGKTTRKNSTPKVPNNSAKRRNSKPDLQHPTKEGSGEAEPPKVKSLEIINTPTAETCDALEIKQSFKEPSRKDKVPQKPIKATRTASIVAAEPCTVQGSGVGPRVIEKQQRQPDDLVSARMTSKWRESPDLVCIPFSVLCEACRTAFGGPLEGSTVGVKKDSEPLPLPPNFLTGNIVQSHTGLSPRTEHRGPNTDRQEEEKKDSLSRKASVKISKQVTVLAEVPPSLLQPAHSETQPSKRAPKQSRQALHGRAVLEAVAPKPGPETPSSLPELVRGAIAAAVPRPLTRGSTASTSSLQLDVDTPTQSSTASPSAAGLSQRFEAAEWPPQQPQAEITMLRAASVHFPQLAQANSTPFSRPRSEVALKRPKPEVLNDPRVSFSLLGSAAGPAAGRPATTAPSDVRRSVDQSERPEEVPVAALARRPTFVETMSVRGSHSNIATTGERTPSPQREEEEDAKFQTGTDNRVLGTLEDWELPAIEQELSPNSRVGKTRSWGSEARQRLQKARTHKRSGEANSGTTLEQQFDFSIIGSQARDRSPPREVPEWYRPHVSGLPGGGGGRWCTIPRPSPNQTLYIAPASPDETVGLDVRSISPSAVMPLLLPSPR
eukprot:TRINITY_DN1651_c0_g1_i4.p1 TRINITY_DN1651_c0_g1~~TRINITY_DN1651_c0_g1_i4.p1  ORF type:complete len:2578 (+),score=414.45 TRINITY_DN1651_c0_g1_i4:56-7789(+)